MKPFALSFLSLSLLCGELLSFEDNTLSALQATYEEENLLLQGEVKVEHGLGTLYAEKAFLKKEDENKDLPFAFVDLEEKVQILCKNKATLHCDTARFDFVTLKGKIGSYGSNLVSYVDTVAHRSESVPVQIQSKAIDVILDRKESPSGPEYTFKDVTAKESVIIRYTEDFVLRADETHYRKESSDSSDDVLTAYPLLPNRYCTLSYKGETLETSFIEIGREKGLLHLKNPKGSLPSSLFSPKQKGQLFLACKDLVWDRLRGILTLREEIELQESHFGCLSTDKILVIEQNTGSDPSFIKSIRAEGKSSLTRGDSLLTSFGSLHVDGLKGLITALSPEKEGKVLLEEQIIYQNNELRLYADTGVLEYTEPLHELSSLTFRGNIRIRSPETAKTARYALADKLLYVPDTKTLILSAHSGKKVLFWDEEQGTVLSAKEVHITQNPVTNQTEIKGIGNMKLSLSPEEQNRLKSYFPEFPQP